MQYDDAYRFTLPVGHQWYARDKGGPPRYTHGGISMAEMVIPRALLERITHTVRRLDLKVIGTLSAIEDEPVILSATVVNVGNRPGGYTLTFYANTGEAEDIRGSIYPQKVGSHTFADHYLHLFEVLSEELIDAAFLDRLHAYLPGWEVPKIQPKTFAQGHGFITDYLAEIFTRLRRRNYQNYSECTCQLWPDDRAQ